MNILAFFAHPDDETILSGGLLALLSSSGNPVHFLCCTRGEGGERGDPPLSPQEGLGNLREGELICAVNALGGKSLKILDYIDPLVGSDNQLFSFTEDIDGLSSALKNQILEKKIDVIISHGSNGEYGHPGHKTVYETVENVIRVNFPELAWYTVQANHGESSKPHLMNQNDPADWVIDTTSVLNMKINAAKCHKSQHALFVRRKTKELGRPVEVEEVIMSDESYHIANGKIDLLKELQAIRENLLFEKGSSSEI